MAGVYLVDEYGNPINSSNPLASTATLVTGDIEIGAVELKDATTSARAAIDATYGLSVDVKRLADGLDATQGAKADAAVQDASSSASLVSLLKGLQAILGLVTASPTSNTVNDRLKTLNTSIVALEALIGEVQASPTANTALDRLKVINTSLVAVEALIGEVQASPTSNTLLDRLKTINTTLAAATPAGTNLIGKTGIDQTTDGTTNRVVAKISQTAGENTVDTELPAAVLLADAKAVPTTSIVGNSPMLYNGSTLDLQRSNIEGTLLASATRTSTTASANQTNYNGKGIVIFFNISAASGTGGLQLRVCGIDPITGNTFFYNSNPTAIVTTGNFAFTYYPGVSSGGTQANSNVLPRTWIVSVTAGDSTNYTYSVGYSLIV